MKRFADQVVLIAAAAGRLGTATTLRLASEGASLVLGDLNGEAVDRLAAEVREKGGEAIGLPLDVTDEESVKSFVAAGLTEFGRVNGAFVNAGLTDPAVVRQDADALLTPLEVFDRTMAVNVRGHLLCARAVLPALLEQGGGGLVFTSSIDAFDGGAERPAYAMSKVALTALVRHIAGRWGKEGIRANAIAPGVIAVDLVAGSPPGTEEYRRVMLERTRSPRLGKGEDIAAGVAHLLSEDGEWINGQVIGIDGGLIMR